jgi:alpha-beta hydrolase superfamily lysophospholipase
MTVVRNELQIDVTSAVGHGEVLQVAATVVAPPRDQLPDRPVVVVATPGGTYNRRYWDLQPPGRTGYSQAEYLAERGVIFVACDYLGGGDSSRPDDADFIGLIAQADAAHGACRYVRQAITGGTLTSALAPIAHATFVGIGQSLGGFITIIQQAKYADYPALGIFGASPLLFAASHDEESADPGDQLAAIVNDIADAGALPMYQKAPREKYRAIFHGPDVLDDLFAYDDAECHTVLPRASAVDGMTAGFATPLAERLTCPLFLAFGETDITAHPRDEPAAYPASSDITTVVFANMAHMHNFADSRTELWDRFLAWLPVAEAEAWSFS